MLKELFEGLSFVTVSRPFFRVLAVGLLILILIAQVSWTENLIGRVLNYPDLRHQITIRPSNEPDLRLARLSVANLGYGKAENVLIHIHSRNGNIAHYSVNSQELYEIKTIDQENGIFDIWLKRLAPNARIRIELTGTALVADTLQLSAVSDQGSSVSDESPGFSDQVDRYATGLTDLFSQTGDIVGKSKPVQQIHHWLSNIPAFSQALRIAQSSSFQTVSLAALIIIVFILLFLPNDFTLFIPFITGLIVFLFFDFQIPTWWIIATIAGPLVLFTLIPGIWATDKELLLAVLLYIAIGGFGIWWYWYDTVSGRIVFTIITFFMTLLLMAAIGAMSQPPKTDKSESRSQTSSQELGTTGSVAQYERHIADLKQALNDKERKYDLLLEQLVVILDYLNGERDSTPP